MSIVPIIRALRDAGATADQIVAAVEAYEAARDDALSRRRASDAARQQAQRDKNNVKSRDVTLSVNGHADTSPHVSEPTQVVTPSLPSLRSEELRTPSPSGDIPISRSCFAKPNGFAKFWELYPNKVAKKAAEAEYCRAIRSIEAPDPASVILAGLERAKRSRQWGEGFIPHPKTWLHQGRWEDEPSEIVPQHATGPPTTFAAQQAAENAEVRRRVLES